MKNTDITKHDVCGIIEAHLKANQIKFSIQENNSKLCIYELFVSSLPCFVQVEYNLDNDDPDVLITFFSEVKSDGLSAYSQEWESYHDSDDSIESHIDDMIDYVKLINRVHAQIVRKIEEIREICEEHELDVDEYIKVEYDFH